MPELFEALLRAMEVGCMVKSKFLSRTEESANTTTESRPRTAAHLFCQPEFIFKIIDELLRSSVEDTVHGKSGRAPLRDACSCKDDQSVVAIFMPHYMRIGVVDSDGVTPLVVKRLSYVHDETMVDCLPALNAEDEFSKGLSYDPEDKRILYVVTLLNCYRSTALHMASMRNNKDVVQMLLSKGAQVGVRDPLGMTALHYAVRNCSAGVVDVLVEHGEDVNAKDCHGDTPLHLIGLCKAVFMPQGQTFEIIDNLLRKGAKVYEKNQDQETPYESLHRFINFDEFSDTSCWLENQEVRKIEETFIKHVTKFKMLKPNAEYDIKWKLGPVFYSSVNYQCRQELKDMKATNIVKDISLYEVLSHINKPYLLSSDDLQKIDEFLSSPDFLTRFPLYGETLRTTFQRPKLLTLAVLSFYTERRKRMVKELPCEVTEQLMTYLTNQDLTNFVNSE